MTARLQRIHRLLRAANVPCALDPRPGVGQVLVAGTSDGGAWDVVVRDNAGQLWVHDARGVERVPTGSTDAAVADTVKFHVVQAWADQGDPEAMAVIAKLDGSPWRQRNGQQRADQPQDLPPIDLFSFLSPFHFAGQMIETAAQFGNVFLARQPAMVSFTVWSPWGHVQGGYRRR